jgi:hypothetical protein
VGRLRDVCRVLVGKPLEERPRGIYSIKMDLQEKGFGRGMAWIVLTQDRNKGWALVNTVMNI